jgi:acetyl-CoA carboxylase carboxyl transferase subunit alpha
MAVILDFEKPIFELEAKLQEMKLLAETNNVDLSSSVNDLSAKIEELKRSIYANLSRWQRVQLARHPERPYTKDYIRNICTSFEELHGDRCGGDDHAIIAGLGFIDQQPLVLIGQQKGRDTKTRQYRNFGMANPEGYRKALRLMKMAEKFRLPVVCLVDTPGAYPGLEAEEHGQAEAIARNLLEMSVLETPILVFVIGEGASGGALGIGVGDRVYMLENTWYSVISPESCSSILWRTWDHKMAAAEALKLSATDNLRLGIIDGIIAEPLGGAHRDPQVVYSAVREKILADLAQLLPLPTEELVAARIEKFVQMGTVANAGQQL